MFGGASEKTREASIFVDCPSNPVDSRRLFVDCLEMHFPCGSLRHCLVVCVPVCVSICDSATAAWVLHDIIQYHALYWNENVIYYFTAWNVVSCCCFMDDLVYRLELVCELS